MKFAVSALLLLLVAGAAAQDAPECDTALGDLRGKLTDVESRLAAAEASGGACTAEAADLRTKLAQAEEAVAANAAAMRELEAKLSAAPAAADVEAERQQLQAGAGCAAAAAAKDSLAAAEAQLSEAAAKLAAREKEVAELRDSMQGVKAEVDSCSASRTSLEGAMKQAAEEAAAKVAAAESSQAAAAKELRQLREEVERVKGEAGAAQRHLGELQRLKAAWLPFWAEEATASLRAAAAPALQQAGALAKQYTAEGSKAATTLWQSHGKPALDRGLSLAQKKGAQLNAAIEARAGDSWPKAKAAAGSAFEAARRAALSGWAAARKAALAAWHSDALAAVRPTLGAAAQRGAAQARQVQAELEELLISVLSKNNSTAPLARRPYVTYLVYAGLLVPLVTFGLPLLGLRRAGPRARVGDSSHATSSGVPKSTKKKKAGKH